MLLRKITVNILTSSLILAAFPFCAAASALEASSSGVNVLGLPTPIITGIDAENSIVQLKADGYLNDNASLLATVALANKDGDVVDVSESKVSDPGNIRVSLHTEQIKVGDSIFVKFSNHGIEGDGADHTLDASDPPEEPEEPVPLPEEPEIAPAPQTIIQKGKGSSSVVYVVTAADAEQIVVEKLVEADPVIIESVKNRWSSPEVVYRDSLYQDAAVEQPTKVTAKPAATVEQPEKLYPISQDNGNQKAINVAIIFAIILLALLAFTVHFVPEGHQN